jgi:hypothetical protein
MSQIQFGVVSGDTYGWPGRPEDSGFSLAIRPEGGAVLAVETEYELLEHRIDQLELEALRNFLDQHT